MSMPNWSPPSGEPQIVGETKLSDPRERTQKSPLARTSPRLVLGIAALSGIAAALSGVSPAGSRPVDMVLTFALAALATWAASTAPWWLLGVVAGIAAAASDLRLFTLVGLIGLGLALFLGWTKRPSDVVGALSGACAVQALCHLRINPYLGASALLAGVLGLMLIIGGTDAKSSDTRFYLRRAALITFGLALLFSALFGLSAMVAKQNITSGYNQLLTGLRQLRAGNTTEAAVSFRAAAADLRQANSTVGGAWTQPARLVPFVAQHRNAVAAIVSDASSSASAAANALDVIDVDRLRVVNGAIDVNAIADLAAPMKNLSDAVQKMSDTLNDSESPWLFTPFQERLDTARVKLDAATLQALAVESAAANGPAMLGADGARKYLVAFTSPGEVRGQSGLIGNWAEVTIDHGALSRTGFGRTSKLIDGIRYGTPFALRAEQDFLDRYGAFGAVDAAGNVSDKFWSNVTMSPDAASVGSVMAQMYEGGGFGKLDGVFIIDTYGLAALLKVTGPVTVPGVETTFTAESLQNFLLYDQYQLEEDVRRMQLEAVADATINLFLSSNLPVPEKLAHDLGPAATEGHIVGWASRPEEQKLMVRMGMSGRLPEPGQSDGLAVVSNNAGGSKIDSFMERSETYTAIYDEDSGVVNAELVVTLNNTAPPSGYPDYVIGNLLGMPSGTNRTMLTIYSPLTATNFTVDGERVGLTAGVERGWNTSTAVIDVGPGELRTVIVQLEGKIAAGDYEMMFRPQPMTRPDSLAISVRAADGGPIVAVTGEINRLSIIDAAGVHSIR